LMKVLEREKDVLPDTDLNFTHFGKFIISFLRHQFNDAIESFVANTTNFQKLEPRQDDEQVDSEGIVEEEEVEAKKVLTLDENEHLRKKRASVQAKARYFGKTVLRDLDRAMRDMQMLIRAKEGDNETSGIMGCLGGPQSEQKSDAEMLKKILAAVKVSHRELNKLQKKASTKERVVIEGILESELLMRETQPLDEQDDDDDEMGGLGGMGLGSDDVKVDIGGDDVDQGSQDVLKMMQSLEDLPDFSPGESMI